MKAFLVFLTFLLFFWNYTFANEVTREKIHHGEQPITPGNFDGIKISELGSGMHRVTFKEGAKVLGNNPDPSRIHTCPDYSNYNKEYGSNYGEAQQVFDNLPGEKITTNDPYIFEKNISPCQKARAYIIPPSKNWDTITHHNSLIRIISQTNFNPGQLWYIDAPGSLQTQLYNRCDYANKEEIVKHLDLSILRRHIHEFRWDETPPACISSFQWDLGIRFQQARKTGESLSESELKSIIQKVANQTSLIISKDPNNPSKRESWKKTWLNKNEFTQTWSLYFYYRCEDEHSQCQWNKSQQGNLFARALKHRETQITDSAFAFKDFVDNENDHTCKIRNQTFQDITKKCVKSLIGGKDYCTYNIQMKDNASPMVLIDRIAPKIQLTPEATYDNPQETLPEKIFVQGGKNREQQKWNFYAGDIKLNFTVTDDTPNKTEDGISGLAWKGVGIYKYVPGQGLVELISHTLPLNDPYSRTDRARENNAHVDNTNSVAHATIPFSIYEPGDYYVMVVTGDNAGNETSLTQEFHVSENFNKNGTFQVVDKSWIEDCKNHHKQTKNIDTKCLNQNTKNSLAGYIVKENDPLSAPLYADAQSNVQFSWRFYDKYFNEFNTRIVKNIRLDSSCISLNQVDETPAGCTPEKNNAITTQWSLRWRFTNNKWQTDINGNFKIRSFSYAPWEFEPHYFAEVCYWDPKGTNDCQDNDKKIPFQIDWKNPQKGKIKFLQILTGKIVIGNGGDDRIVLGVDNTISFALSATQWNLTSNILEPFSIKDFSKTLKILDRLAQLAGITKKSFSKDDFSVYKNLQNEKITGSILVEQKANFNANTKTLEFSSEPFIEIKMSGLDRIEKTAKYYITDREDNFQKGINYQQSGQWRIYIQGNKQTIGKESLVSDQINLLSAKFSPAILRDKIHKNAHLLIRNRESENKTINHVRYLEGNQTLKNLGDDWNTLIIRNGNLTIDENFNTAKKNLAIILISDSRFDENRDVANIKITPNVTFIGANIYTDGSIFSVRDDKTNFTKTDTERTDILQKQIVFHGSIFSHNTVGGAVLSSDKQYILPTLFSPNHINPTEANLVKAIKYDLSFLRMNNRDHAMNDNNGHDESVVVIGTPENRLNELPIFSFRE